MAAGLRHCWERGCATDAVLPAGCGRILSFVQGAGEYSPTLHKGHRGIFNVNRLVPTDGTPV